SGCLTRRSLETRSRCWKTSASRLKRRGLWSALAIIPSERRCGRYYNSVRAVTRLILARFGAAGSLPGVEFACQDYFLRIAALPVAGPRSGTNVAGAGKRWLAGLLRPWQMPRIPSSRDKREPMATDRAESLGP